jgi:lipid-A-disaccharide synthase
MKYYIIAGEASGDLHASNLMKELRVLDPQAEFRCWGGDRMASQGGTLVKHISELAFMGFWEVLVNISAILRNIRQCKSDLLEYRPDVLILVDYPGFNLRIAEFARRQGMRVVYYISPQIWAWKQSRVKKIRRDVDKMLVILPFEKAFYQRFNYPVEFPGHPLLDAIAAETGTHDRDGFLKNNHLPDKPLVALLPGSRRQEIARMLGVMTGIAPRFPEVQFVIAGLSGHNHDFYGAFAENGNISIVFDQTYPLLLNARAALVASGTATLETALFDVPQAVCYKAGKISYHIARKLIKVKYISLVNLIMDRPVVKELIQDDLNEKTLEAELRRLLYDDISRKAMLNDYQVLRQKLGGTGASKKAARIIHQYITGDVE